MNEKTRRIYLYNRSNGIDTVAYIQESILTALNGQIYDFKDLKPHISPSQRESLLNRLGACPHNPPTIEITPKHYTLMNWETLR
jgi:hypothetical protein